ncbi:hypothetical protein SETIT_1G055600v2 [Setaria italica]|uniref:Uncharacterized protein n=2 Tax=Setaria TaxID=4554 RepID=A0A368PH69_SETIT|nr:hypothetical protein SETIT_1G055600v2 [Setaria italica]RCV05106.1 hypothetical protein SETIT_1G055600v2 [Setaria italica]TKW37551.1 hypothetical protein SEVIR_1G054900v2 [Setaria viridis]
MTHPKLLAASFLQVPLPPQAILQSVCSDPSIFEKGHNGSGVHSSLRNTGTAARSTGFNY